MIRIGFLLRLFLALLWTGTPSALAADSTKVDLCDFSEIALRDGKCPVGFFMDTRHSCRKKMHGSGAWHSATRCECRNRKEELRLGLEVKTIDFMEKYMKQAPTCIPRLTPFFFKLREGATLDQLTAIANANQIFNLNDCGAPGESKPLTDTSIELYEKAKATQNPVSFPMSVPNRYGLKVGAGSVMSIDENVLASGAHMLFNNASGNEWPAATARKGILDFDFKGRRLTKIIVKLKPGEKTEYNPDLDIDQTVADPNSIRGKLELSLIRGKWVIALGKALSEVTKEIQDGKITSISDGCQDLYEAVADQNLRKNQMLRGARFRETFACKKDSPLNQDWIDLALNPRSEYTEGEDQFLMLAPDIATVINTHRAKLDEFLYCEVTRRADHSFSANYLGDWNKILTDLMKGKGPAEGRSWEGTFGTGVSDAGSEVKEHCSGLGKNDRDHPFHKFLEKWQPGYRRNNTGGSAKKFRSCVAKAISAYYPYLAMRTFDEDFDPAKPSSIDPERSFYWVDIKTKKHMAVMETLAPSTEETE